jgi:hypothetical protein
MCVRRWQEVRFATWSIEIAYDRPVQRRNRGVGEGNLASLFRPFDVNESTNQGAAPHPIPYARQRGRHHGGQEGTRGAVSRSARARPL